MFLHPYYTPNEHNCTRKKSEMLLLQQRKSQNTIDTHIKLKFCSQPRHIRAGGIFYLCFLCAPAGGNTGGGVLRGGDIEPPTVMMNRVNLHKG